MLKFTFNKVALDQMREDLKQALNSNTISFYEYCEEIKRLMRFATLWSIDVGESV